MMGSADALPTAPEQKTQFIEDMTDAQVAKAVRLHIFIKELNIFLLANEMEFFIGSFSNSSEKKMPQIYLLLVFWSNSNTYITLLKLILFAFSI